MAGPHNGRDDDVDALADPDPDEHVAADQDTPPGFLRSPDTESLHGTILNGCYELGAEIGRGSFGAVWRARHIELDTWVAVKLLHAQYARDQSYVNALRREARVTARLHERSDYIVPVTHVGEHEGLTYYVMPVLQGMNLEDYLNEKGSLSLRDMKRLLEQLLRAVKVAHAEGVIHRDLKPRNIFVETKEERPRIRILDFGIANARDFLTTTHQHVEEPARPGTIQYMPPEWISGTPPKPAPSIDVFSIGLIAYQMILGRHPLDGFSPTKIASRYAAGTELEKLHRLPEGQSAEIPEDVAEVISTALRYDPAQRYTDAGAMLTALKRTDVFDPKHMPKGLVINNRYVVGKRTGTGGMGAVYEVVDKSAANKAALKILTPPPGAKPDELHLLYARFDRECDIIWHHVKHDHVVAIVDKGHHRNTPYCVMELVDGLTLKEAAPHIWKKPDGWFRMLRLLRKIAAALDAVHAAKITHRDVKPDNIVVDMITEAPKLIDFGIAGIPSSELTATGVAVGTPGFAAPEQLEGKPSHNQNDPVGPRSDQWGFSAMFYTFLAGFRPGSEPGENPPDGRIDRNVLEGNIVDLGELRPADEVPVGVSAAIMRGLAKDPNDRFDSVVELVDEVIAHSIGCNIAPDGKPRPTTGEIILDAGPSREDSAQQATTATVSGGRPRWSVLVVIAAAVAGGIGVWAATRGDNSNATPPAVAAGTGTAGAERSDESSVEVAHPNAAVDAAARAVNDGVRVRVVAVRRGKERPGIQLLVDGEKQTSPVQLERAPGSRMSIEVTDPRYRRTSTSCTVSDEPEVVCSVQLKRRASSQPPRRKRPIMDVVGDDENE